MSGGPICDVCCRSRAHFVSAALAPPGRGRWRRARLALIAGWHAGELDRQLAAGASPGATALLAIRGERLTSRRYRARIAAGLARAVRDAEGARRAASAQRFGRTGARWSPPVPCSRPSIAGCVRPSRSAPRGSRCSSRCSPTVRSPLYRPTEPGALGSRLRAAAAALEPLARQPTRSASARRPRDEHGAQAQPARGGPQDRLRRSTGGQRARRGVRGHAEAVRGAGRLQPRRDRSSRAGGPGAGCARGRLRGHRHQPAVHRAGHLQLVQGHGAHHAGDRVRDRVVDLLGADGRRVDQIRGLHHARAQPRRRRDHGADRPAAAQQGRPRSAARDARDLRRRAVLRRRHDHPRDLGARRDPGSSGRHAGAGAPRRAAVGRDPARPVHPAAVRVGNDRMVVRTDHPRLVLGDRADRPEPGGQGPGGVPGALSDLGHPVLRRSRRRRLPRARRRGAGGDGRGGPVRRPGPLRRGADPHGLVRPRATGADPQLPGPGSLHPPPPGAGEGREHVQSLLPDDPALGPVADGRARRRRHGDRLPGRDLGLVLGGQASRAAWLPPEAASSAHVHGRGPDLRPDHQLAAVRRRAHADARVPLLQQAGRHLRRRGDGHVHPQHRAVPRRRAAACGAGPNGSWRRSRCCS